MDRFLIRWILLLMTACSGAKDLPSGDGKSRLTVIHTDNQHPGYEFQTDTLMYRKPINLDSVKIDVYFTNKAFHIPYYVPVDGMYRNAKQGEAAIKGKGIANVRYYTYDEKDRVVYMKVSGSGTFSDYQYKYDNKGRLKRIIEDGYEVYTLRYNSDGNLISMHKKGIDLKGELMFVYE